MCIRDRIDSLKRDNVRLAKIVDHGAWGDHQLSLIQSAVDLLADEKRALAKVIEQFPWVRDRRIIRDAMKRAPCELDRASSRGKVPMKMEQRHRESTSQQLLQSKPKAMKQSMEQECTDMKDKPLFGNVAVMKLPAASFHSRFKSLHAHFIALGYPDEYCTTCLE